MAGQPIPAELTAAYEAALEAGDVDGVLAAANTLQQRGHSRSGEAWLRHAWRSFPDEPRFVLRLMDIYLRYRTWEDFDPMAEMAVTRHAEEAEVHYAIGCGHEARGQWQAAAEAFGRAADLSDAEIEARIRQVRSLRVQGESVQAQKIIKRALKLHPTEASLHAQMGYTNIDRQRPLEAAKWFERALERQPDWQPYLDDLAGAYMLSERWQDAARTAIRSLDRRKKNERAWTVYAIAHHRLGHAERANQGHVNAIRSASNPARAQGNFGLFLATEPTRLLEAIRMLEAAHHAHPDWDEVAVALDDLLDR